MSSTGSLMGVETEYAVTGMDGPGSTTPRSLLVDRLMDRAKAKFPHLCDIKSRASIFLQNGSRLYIDSGHHPELSTPECADPWEVVRYARAGDAMLFILAREVEAAPGGPAKVLVFRGNVDYSGSGTTWGSHESYLHRGRCAQLSDQLVPHLVTRVIYCGSGGFDSKAPGIELVLSPRAPHLCRVVSGSSTEGRGIFHTKNEPLCGGGYRRLHLICGERSWSDQAELLRIGTTALTLCLVEAGIRPGHPVALRSPVEALHAVARDPRRRCGIELASGGLATAIGIQCHYLQQAWFHRNDDFMPSWTEDLCRIWQRALLDLQRNHPRVGTSFDWAIKLALYRDFFRRRGVEWEQRGLWNAVLRGLAKVHLRTNGGGQKLQPEELLVGRHRVLERAVRTLSMPVPRRERWKMLRSFIRLRQELFEIDTRFGELGEDGIFPSLDRQGVLTHRVPALGGYHRAMIHPPSNGRARVRGEVIRCLSAANGSVDGRISCSWDRVKDRDRARMIDLSDPFVERASWGPMRGGGLGDDPDFPW